MSTNTWMLIKRLKTKKKRKKSNCKWLSNLLKLLKDGTGRNATEQYLWESTKPRNTIYWTSYCSVRSVNKTSTGRYGCSVKFKAIYSVPSNVMLFRRLPYFRPVISCVPCFSNDHLLVLRKFQYFVIIKILHKIPQNKDNVDESKIWGDFLWRKVTRFFTIVVHCYHVNINASGKNLKVKFLKKRYNSNVLYALLRLV